MPWKDKEKHRITNKRWCENNPERSKEVQRNSYCKRRLEAILAYSPSGTCSMCPENGVPFLAIDHADGGGKEHRDDPSVKGSGIIGWLKKNNYPPGFRVLCHNCHHKYGVKKQPTKVRKLPEEMATVKSMAAEKYRRAHPEKYEEQKRRQRDRNKQRNAIVFAGYGGMCACCSKDDFDVLCVDHVHGGGRKHLREARMSQSQFYAWLINNNFPSEYQVLCMNCNTAKGQKDCCPHAPQPSRL